jgi:hypothetical protein
MQNECFVLRCVSRDKRRAICFSTHTRVKVWKKSAACIQKQVVSLSAHLLDMTLLLLLLLLLQLTIASCYS